MIAIVVSPFLAHYLFLVISVLAFVGAVSIFTLIVIVDHRYDRRSHFDVILMTIDAPVSIALTMAALAGRYASLPS